MPSAAPQPSRPPGADGPKTGQDGGFSAHRRALDAEVGRLAVEQHGVVTLEQLEALGLTGDAIVKRVARGRIHRIHQTVYALTPKLMAQRGHLMAAVLACGPGAVLSHRAAAYLWGLTDELPELIDVTAPHRRGRSPAGVAAHRDRSLQPIDKTRLHGIPCTTLARALLDYAGVVPEWELRRAVSQAEVLGLVDRRALRSVLRRGRGRRGVARLRLTFDTLHPQTRRTRSELERLLLAMCIAAGLPQPEVNVWLDVPGGDPLQADFLWRGQRLIVEADSREFHDTASAFEQDRKREQRFQLANWRVLRCTWAQVRREPQRLAATIRAVLAQAKPSSPVTNP